jgi:hypothetical protein
MNKITLTLAQIMAASQALALILRQKGIPARTSYWLKRNFDHLYPKEKNFRDLIKRTFEEDKRAIESDGLSFIPPEKYKAFKAGLVKQISVRDDEQLLAYIQSFEIEIKKGQLFMSPKDMEDFNVEANRLAEEMKDEIEYTPILMDEKFDAALSVIPAGTLGDIWWMITIDAENAEADAQECGLRRTTVALPKNY